MAYLRWIALFGVAVIGAIGLWSLPEAPRRAPSSPYVSGDPLAENREIFLDTRLDPILAEAKARNDKAAERALQTLRDEFEAYRKGVEPFADDIYGWKSKFVVVWLQGKSLLRVGDEAAVEAYVTDKFNHHIVSAERLRKALERCTKQYETDLEASRNQLVVDLRAAVKSEQLALQMSDAEVENLVGQMENRSREIVASLPAEVYKGLGVVVVSEASGGAATMLAVTILSKLGITAATTTATTAATSGSATAAGAAAGGAGGTFFTPGVGTAVGAAFGLIVGLVIDWQLSDHFAEKLSEQCKAFLDELEHGVVFGDKSEKSIGLREFFDESNRRSIDGWRTAISQQMRGET